MIEFIDGLDFKILDAAIVLCGLTLTVSILLITKKRNPDCNKCYAMGYKCANCMENEE